MTINSCLKRSFVFFNVLFAIFGCLLFALALFAHVSVDKKEDIFAGIQFLYVCGIITFTVSCLGVYGAVREKKYALIAFAVCMVLTFTGILFLFIPAAIGFPKVMSSVKDYLSTTHLNEQSDSVQQTMNLIQKELQCCGLFKGYEDWGGDVPESCDCRPEYTEHERCQQITTGERYFWKSDKQRRMIVSKKCGPLMMEMLQKVWTISMGIVFGFAALALLGALLSITMACQIGSGKSPPLEFSLDQQPPKYSELVKIS